MGPAVQQDLLGGRPPFAGTYRMRGPLSEADGAVQESWLRLSSSKPSAVGNLRGWLTRLPKISPKPLRRSVADNFSTA